MKYKLVQLPEVIAAIKNGPIAFDTETDGKYGKICIAQFYQRGWPEVLIIQSPEPISLWAALRQLDNTLVIQNASYDISTIQRQTGAAWIPNAYEDTLLLARIAFPSLDGYSLDKLLTHVLGADPYLAHGIDKKVMQKAKWNTPVLPHKQLEYGAIDVWHLLDLYDAVSDKVDDFSYKLDKHALNCALDFQRNGMVVDHDRVDTMYSENEARVAELNLPINVNSYKQVRPYIESEHSDGLGLATLALRGNTKAANVKEARSLIKLNSFLDKYRTDDGKIYGIFGPYARSGRFTCSDQNLEQLPRKTKGCFGVEPGRLMLYSDYSQLELRSIAAITGDRRMVELYKAGGDIHDLVSEMINISRQIAKTINFNGLYGGGANMMRNILIKEANLLLPPHEVATSLKKWKNMFPSVKAWQERGIRDFNGGRLGSTACGRKYRGRLMTDQLNIENQGTGAEVAKLAMHYMYNDLGKNDCYMTNFIHDSYIIDAPEDEAIIAEVSMRMAEAMQEAWFEVSKSLKVKDIPMPVQVLGGYNWGDIEAGAYTYKYEVS